MKPLSALNYSRNNRKKVVAATTCIMVSVFLIYTFHIIFSTLNNSVGYVLLNSLKAYSQIMPAAKAKPISDSIIKDIANSPGTEKVIPVKLQETPFITLAWDTSASFYSIREDDMGYFLNKLKIRIVEGRLPQKNTDEVAIDYRIAKNKGLKLGDKFGHGVDKTEEIPGEYSIVGILDGDSAVGIMPYSEDANDNDLYKYGMLAFYNDSDRQMLDGYLSTVQKSEANALTFSMCRDGVNKAMLNSANMIINLILVLAIAVMAVSVGNSTYTHFLERRKEFGILHAIGYSRTEVIRKALLEITLMNAAGFIAGIALSLISGELLKAGYLGPLGLMPDIWTLDGFIKALCIPVFTTLFSIVPINSMITKIDPINIIEGVN